MPIWLFNQIEYWMYKYNVIEYEIARDFDRQTAKHTVVDDG